MTSAFSMSQVARDLFEAAGVNPRRVNDVIERRLRRGHEALLRPGHHYTSLVRRVTGSPLQLIARRNRHLLIHIESRSPLWCYEERSRGECVFHLPKRFPATLSSAAAGRPFSALVGGLAYLADRPIVRIEPDGDWTEVAVDAGWSKITN